MQVEKSKIQKAQELVDNLNQIQQSINKQSCEIARVYIDQQQIRTKKKRIDDLKYYITTDKNAEIVFRIIFANNFEIESITAKNLLNEDVELNLAEYQYSNLYYGFTPNEDTIIKITLKILMYKFRLVALYA